MGMCRGCEEVFNTNDMVDGYCQNCVNNEIVDKPKDEEQRKSENIVGFHWWTIWGWLALITGNLYLWGRLEDVKEVAFVFILINTILMIFVLRFNKYAFLIATIVSFNPLLWIINGIYLKNRWSHPKVNGGKIVEEVKETTWENNSNERYSLRKTYSFNEMSFETAKKLINDFYIEYGYEVIIDDENSFVLKNKKIEDSHILITKQNVSKKIQVEIKKVSHLIDLKNSDVYEEKVENKYDSIGGWLILVAIGLILSHFNIIGDFIGFNNEEVKDNVVYTYKTGDYDWLIKYTILIWADAIILFLVTLSTLHFFSRSITTKKLLILCYSTFIILSLVSMGILDSMGIKESSSEITKRFFGMFMSLVWIFYFFLSKRVKGTFVLEQTPLRHGVKVIISLILPIVLIFFYYNMLSVQKYEAHKLIETKKENQIKEEKKKKEVLTLNFYRELFESESQFINILKKKKQSIIDTEVNTFKEIFSIKDKSLLTEKQILNYVDENSQYPNFVKGILYFCGKECSKLNQNLDSSYNYLSKSEKDIKNESSIILAEMNLYGIGTSQNIEKAVSLAANSDIKDASFKATKYYYLGVGYLLGKYYKKDIDKSISYFKNSANLNNNNSAYLTALLMATEKDKYTEKEIVSFFNKSTKLGNPSSEMMLGLYYNENNKKVKAKSVLSNCYYSNKNCKFLYEELFDETTTKN